MPRMTEHELQKRTNEMRFIVAIEDFIFYLHLHEQWDKQDHQERLILAERLLAEKKEQGQLASQDNQPAQTQNATELQNDSAKEYLEQLQKLFSEFQKYFTNAIDEACVAIKKSSVLTQPQKIAAIAVVKQTLTLQAFGNAATRVLVTSQPANRAAPQFKQPFNDVLEEHVQKHLHEPLKKAHSEYEASANQRTAKQDDKTLFLGFTQLLINLEFAFNAKNDRVLKDTSEEAMLDIFSLFQNPAKKLAELSYMTVTVPEIRHNFFGNLADFAGNPNRFQYAGKPEKSFAPVPVPGLAQTAKSLFKIFFCTGIVMHINNQLKRIFCAQTVSKRCHQGAI